MKAIFAFALAMLTLFAIGVLEKAHGHEEIDDPILDPLYKQPEVPSMIDKIMEPPVVVPIPPSTTGPSYFGQDWTYTQEQNCYRDHTLYIMRCYPR